MQGAQGALKELVPGSSMAASCREKFPRKLFAGVVRVVGRLAAFRNAPSDAEAALVRSGALSVEDRAQSNAKARAKAIPNPKS